MATCAEQYPEYSFDRNIGCGTAEHIAALRKYSPTPCTAKPLSGIFSKEERSDETVFDAGIDRPAVLDAGGWFGGKSVAKRRL